MDRYINTHIQTEAVVFVPSPLCYFLCISHIRHDLKSQVERSLAPLAPASPLQLHVLDLTALHPFYVVLLLII